MACCKRHCWCSSTILGPSKKFSFFAFANRRPWQDDNLLGNTCECELCYKLWLLKALFLNFWSADEHSFSFKLLFSINWQQQHLFSCSSFLFLHFEALFRTLLELILAFSWWSEDLFNFCSFFLVYGGFSQYCTGIFLLYPATLCALS